ncbi:MAG TPA: CDP-diacylglycerol--glycerol-3-phosphate 3-phosphatidyltransferase [Mycobacteriales bacterium]|jgi:CDP-diacylglycerol--glycerol-3-phosphate 3-phosphatidyltransferase|nr:CDP-diacylglycerol--glycerol-3-phosphate 3-phosphatidyltransferase [Mycobacteriales bacterium]
MTAGVGDALEPSPWNLANALTVFRLVLVPCFAVFLWLSEGNAASWLVAAAGVFVAGIVTDYYDGALARSRGTVTSFGKLADPIADKALTGTALVGLCLLNLLSWPVAVIIVIREVGVTALRFVVIRRGIIAASWGGKAKTALQMLAIAWYLWPWQAMASWLHDTVGFGSSLHVLSDIGPPLMALAVAVTVITGLDYVRQAWKMRQ